MGSSLAGFKDYEILPSQLIPIPVSPSTGSTLPTTGGSTLTVDLSGEQLAFIVDNTSTWGVICQKNTFGPISQGEGVYPTVEIAPGILVWNGGNYAFFNNFSDLPVQIEGTTVYPRKQFYYSLNSVADGCCKQAANNPPQASNSNCPAARFADFRFKLSPPALNNTYPSVGDPGALAGFTSAGTTASGGVLAATTHYAKLCWITKTNTTRTAYGITLPSNAISQVCSANDSWQITIPALPTNCIGYAIFHSTDGVNYYQIGASNAVGASAFTVKSAYAQLANAGAVFGGKNGLNQMLFTTNGSNGLFGLDCSVIPGASNATWTSVITTTNGHARGLTWSPWQPDTSILHYMLGGNSVGNSTVVPVDKISLIGLAHSLNQAVSVNTGIPYLRPESNECYYVISVPELAAYAVLSSGGTSRAYGWVRLYSYLNGALIWSWYMAAPVSFYISTGIGKGNKFCDFQTIDGVTYMVANMWWLRSVARVPIRIPA